MSGMLAGKVCIVTGASRGIGKGIALQLGEAGATVYITGRTLQSKEGLPGSLQETADEVQSRGGKCIPVQCDHGNPQEVEQLFERVKQEQSGQLDVLVNNAYAGVNVIMDNIGKPFYETDAVGTWDAINNVGLRNHYICSVYASRMMVPRKQGLIVNISSGGGLKYLFNVAYGIGKAACDRMAADCGHELRKQNVAFVSLWPGAVRTENINSMLNASKDNPKMEKTRDMFAEGESTEYAGKCIAYLAADPKIMSKTGRILLSAELGEQYGFTDIDGKKVEFPAYFLAFKNKALKSKM